MRLPSYYYLIIMSVDFQKVWGFVFADLDRFFYYYFMIVIGLTGEKRDIF